MNNIERKISEAKKIIQEWVDTGISLPLDSGRFFPESS